jgi:hypothetical protein
LLSLFRKPLDHAFVDLWNGIDSAYRGAFFVVVAVNLLAFGYEMTNLTIHHDDVWSIFIQDTILGRYLGRFGLGLFNYYGQGAYFMPFLQMFQAIVFMTAYGMVISRLWGLRKTMDIAIVSSILCVFPYMAQIYQYNVAMASYSLAHLLAAVAVSWSIRSTPRYLAGAAALYVAAFSIYQSVIANAGVIYCFWTICEILREPKQEVNVFRSWRRSTLGVLMAVGLGSGIYLILVSFYNITFDSYQAAEEGFNLEQLLGITYALNEIIEGTKSFFLWPENYFPYYLKILQLIFVITAAVVCLWLPKSVSRKIAAVAMLVIATFVPRILQLIHPSGTYHALTLTSYAVVIAGCTMVINRVGLKMRNASVIVSIGLILGFIMQCNWISTVNHLNTFAHYTTLTQILARISSLPSEKPGEEKVIVVGEYKMPSDYPFKRATGVATNYINAKGMQHLARLMRQKTVFIDVDHTMQDVLDYAVAHASWPDFESVNIVNGTKVVVLSNDHLVRKKRSEQP